MTRALTVALLVAALAVTAFAKDRWKEAPAAYVHWGTAWEAALAEAKERNVPVMIAFHKDH